MKYNIKNVEENEPKQEFVRYLQEALGLLENPDCWNIENIWCAPLKNSECVKEYTIYKLACKIFDVETKEKNKEFKNIIDDLKWRITMLEEKCQK